MGCRGRVARGEARISGCKRGSECAVDGHAGGIPNGQGQGVRVGKGIRTLEWKPAHSTFRGSQLSHTNARYSLPGTVLG